MAKKKNKPQVINNIQELNLEIDYDKLAESMLKVHNAHASQKRKKSLRERAISFMNGMMYSLVYVVAVLSIDEIWKDYGMVQSSLISSILGTIALIFIGIYAFLCQQESLGDDGETAMNHFNSNISLIALLIAMIAFFKGVG